VTGVFVHAVVPATFAAPSLTGVGEPPAAVRTIRTAALGALVSDLPTDRAPGTRADLEAHSNVLAEIVDRGVTVVPVRFGMVFPNDDAVRERLLDRQRERLVELLGELGGRIQITLKATYAEGVALREVAAADPRIARLSEMTRGRPDAEVHAQKIQLGELVASGLERRRKADERLLLEHLSPFAEKVVTEEPKHERVAAHAQLLVRRDRLQALETALGQLTEQQQGRMSVRAIGPLAPWSFADVQLADPEPAWA
jgi:hypothetical protein